MTEELIEFMKKAREQSTEKKLELFLSISEKIMALMFSLESQNRVLVKRVKDIENKLQTNRMGLEYKNRPAHPPPPPPPPSTAPLLSAIKENIRGDIMGELKELFRKRDGVGKT